MISSLKQMQARIKGARLYKGEKNGIERLYFRYGKNNAQYKTSAWFEIVNDRITPFVKVENNRHADYYDESLASSYKEEIYKQFHELLNNCELERKKIPLHDRLKDDTVPVHEDSFLYQANALRFCCTMKTTALFGEPGTTKTKISIDLARSRYHAGKINKVLVFCPTSTKKNFMQEIVKWKAEYIEWRIIGHEAMGSSDRIFLDTLKYVDNQTMIIIDESHFVKTPFAKRSKRIKMCCNRCSYKLIMTGTPAESVKDIYMQFSMLSDLIIDVPNWLKFEEKYLIMGGVNGDEVIGYKNIDYLMGLLEPYTYQIFKKDAIILPAKTFKTLTCSLTDEQAYAYEETKQEFLHRLENLDEYVPPTLIFQYLTKLQEIACGFLFDKEVGGYEFFKTNKFDVLETTDFRDGQTVFFCKYLYEADILIEYLGEENCARFTGQNPKTRDAEKDLFTTKQKQFFVSTMGTGGTGLNGLQYCNRMVFLSKSFKYIQYEQCIARIDRPGQEREMTIYEIETRSGIDEKIRKNIARKGNLADEIKGLLNDKTKLKQYIEEL